MKDILNNMIDILKKDDYWIARGIREKRIYRVQLDAYKISLKWIQKALDHYISSDEQEIINQIKEPYQTLPGYEQQLKEEHSPIPSENPYHRENLIHQNSIGEMFRSKAEMQISEILLKQNVPYRYEKLLEIDGEQKYPDFTIKGSEHGKEKYIEYFGMIDNEIYGKAMANKIDWYLKHGMVHGRDVLFLYGNSTSGMDSIEIIRQINYLTGRGTSD